MSAGTPAVGLLQQLSRAKLASNIRIPGTMLVLPNPQQQLALRRQSCPGLGSKCWLLGTSPLPITAAQLLRLCLAAHIPFPCPLALPLPPLQTWMNPIRNKPSPDDSVAVSGAPTKQRKLTRIPSLPPPPVLLPPSPRPCARADYMNPIRNKPSPDDSVSVAGAPAKQRKLTYPDLQGYKEFVSAFVNSPVDYADSMPTSPVVDASQWIEANFKEVGGDSGGGVCFWGVGWLQVGGGDSQCDGLGCMMAGEGGSRLNGLEGLW